MTPGKVIKYVRQKSNFGFHTVEHFFQVFNVYLAKKVSKSVTKVSQKGNTVLHGY